jgi:radical SAM protein (TIGR01212 family)
MRYNSYRSYLKKRFGKPVLKIPLNAGFSCPNRDGSIGTKGCSFCDNISFSPVAISSQNLIEQLNNAIKKNNKKHDIFLAYFQPFSNTYGSIDQLKKAYEPVINFPNVVGISIGTRPDCFTKEIFDYLEEISKRTYVCIELGLQSCHNKTLSINNRGHTVEIFSQTVYELSKRNIETSAHVILGLPYETEEEMIQTAKYLSSIPVCGVKIHQLMIISNTLVCEWYNKGLVKPFTLEQYSKILCKFIAHLRPDQLIHRIMADSKIQKGLIAPLWSEEKIKSIKFIHEYMDKINFIQGSEYIKR